MSRDGRGSGAGRRGSGAAPKDLKLLGQRERHDKGECSFSHTHKEKFVSLF